MKLENNLNRSKRFTLSTLLTILLSIGFFFANAEVDKAQWADGKSLFKSNCAACHNPKADGTGPALQGVTARWEASGDFKGKTGKQWLHVWIKNWNDAVAAGDKYAVDMAGSRPAAMNVFATLKDEDIDKILLYVENPDAGAPATAAAPTTASTEPKAEEGASASLFCFLPLIISSYSSRGYQSTG